MHGTAAPDSEWEAHLDEGWDRERVAAVSGRFPELILQQQSEQRPHKVSYKLFAADAAQANGTVSNLRSALAAAGLDANVVFSGGEDLDVLPARASKGKALSFLLRQIEGALGSSSEETSTPTPLVLVAGDSGNDIDLFAVPGVRCCMVANAHPELREWCQSQLQSSDGDRLFSADQDGPGGIVQALHHFGFVPDYNDKHTAGSSGRRIAVVQLHQKFEDWLNAKGRSLMAMPRQDQLHPSEEEESTDNMEDFSPTGVGLPGLEASLAAGFELVGPSGVVTSRAELLRWFREKGWGSRLNDGAADPLAHTSEGHQGLLAAAIAGETAVPAGLEVKKTGNGGPHSGGVFRIWIDSVFEREIVEGVWLVRYKELQQRFLPEGQKKAGGRTSRWSSAVLRRGGDDGEFYVWEHVHETWLPGGGEHAASS